MTRREVFHPRRDFLFLRFSWHRACRSPFAGFGGGGPFFTDRDVARADYPTILADPSALLKKYPNGGPQLLTRVREVVAYDPATLNTIVGLIQSANPNQANAIGIGLGQAALKAVKTDQPYANRIQEGIAKAEIISDVSAGERSTQPKIGSAVTTKNQVEGVTEKGTGPIVVARESI